MDSIGQARTRAFIRLWTALVLVAIYLPILCGALAGLSKGRYFGFPVRAFSLDWWQKTVDSFEIHTLVQNSLLIALIVTFVSVFFAFFGALAFARYDWKGRRLFQKVLLLPIFFPQPVLGLALLLWFNALGISPSWQTAVVAHLVWIVPVVTLVIAIQVYGFDPTLEEAAADLGASRLFILREVTLPILWPGSGRARCSPSSCRGAIFRCRSIRRASIPRFRSGSIPRWWRAIRRWCRRSAP